MDSPSRDRVTVGGRYQPDNQISADADSRFKGLVSMKNGGWGARIFQGSRAHWAGIYNVKEEAAVACDRAAIKLQKGEFSLNFPSSNYAPEEILFQSRYPTEAIMQMLRDKTYSACLANFTTQVSSRTGVNPDLQRIFDRLFHKQLTQSDIACGYLFIPKVYALAYFPRLGVEGDGNVKSVAMKFFDKFQHSWTFLYEMRRRTFVLSTGWRDFVRENDLKSGDEAIFYRYEENVDQERKMYFMIDVQKNNRQNLIGGGSSRHMIGLENGNQDDANMEEEKKCKFKLFGVPIY